jgi:hypothetical protein
MKAGVRLPVLDWLPDGSYTSVVVDPRTPGLRRQQVLASAAAGHLDPDQGCAADLAAAYHQRWEPESTFDEIKTHQRGPARVLRSRSPEMVRQEVWAFLLSHYGVRRLMCDAADEADVDPDTLSFTRSLRVIRRHVTGQADFPPRTRKEVLADTTEEITERRTEAEDTEQTPEPSNVEDTTPTPSNESTANQQTTHTGPPTTKILSPTLS